jgi:hypothetical protein
LLYWINCGCDAWIENGWSFSEPSLLSWRAVVVFLVDLYWERWLIKFFHSRLAIWFDLFFLSETVVALCLFDFCFFLFSSSSCNFVRALSLVSLSQNGRLIARLRPDAEGIAVSIKILIAVVIADRGHWPDVRSTLDKLEAIKFYMTGFDASTKLIVEEVALKGSWKLVVGKVFGWLTTVGCISRKEDIIFPIRVVLLTTVYWCIFNNIRPNGIDRWW